MVFLWGKVFESSASRYAGAEVSDEGARDGRAPAPARARNLLPELAGRRQGGGLPAVPVVGTRVSRRRRRAAPATAQFPQGSAVEPHLRH